MAPLSDGEPPGAAAPRGNPTIALIGFMGAGKTRAAKGIGDELGRPVADSDTEIERELGEPIAAFFERADEGAFREAEESVVLRLLAEGNVVSLGGGAVESPRVREALGGCFTIWCRIDEELAWERASRDGARPLAREREAFAARYAARAPIYGALARAVLDSGGERTARAAARWIDSIAGIEGSRFAWATARSGSYPVLVAKGATTAIQVVSSPANGSAAASGRWFGIVDKTAFEHHGQTLNGISGWVHVDGGEASKTLTEAERVLRELARQGVRRDDGIVAFGGGVIGDLAGFCAATYQRGIPVIQVPTTLVAQVDSAYGGKTGVDLPEAKNYAGVYHMPTAVITDPGYLATLPGEELAAGFAEVIKTALLAGGELWERVRRIERLDAAEIGEVVFDCALTKIDVVAADERDGGSRQQLNLGHTIGHGIEAAAGYERYRHGEAISLGLLAALRLSGAEELRAEVAALLERTGLPTRLAPEVGTEETMQALSRDKKRTAEGIGFVLLEVPGEPKIGQAIDQAMVRTAVEELR